MADEGTYNAVAFRYSADYYDPSQPTEEEEANKEAGGIRTSLETTQNFKNHILTLNCCLSLPEEVQFLRQVSVLLRHTSASKCSGMKRGHFP